MAEKEHIQAPFNMALYTLESIRKWIDKIAEISLCWQGGEKINPNEMIIIKHKMVKQLIMLSTPLLDEDELKKVELTFSKIEIHKGDIRTPSGWSRNVPVYTVSVDYELDECVQQIERSLQDGGHFMPAPDESALF